MYQFEQEKTFLYAQIEIEKFKGGSINVYRI